MKLMCRIAGHSGAENVVYNGGFFFGRCGRCHTPRIRTGRGAWQDVPAGHAVAWKSGRHNHSLPADFTGLLPIAVQETKLPATQDRFASWSRALVSKMLPRSRRARAAAATAAAVSNEVEERPVPALLVVALLFGAGMRLFLSPRRR